MLTIHVSRTSAHNYETALKPVSGEIVRIVRRGGVIVYPTETLYGLGISARKKGAAAKAIAIKGSVRNAPVSVALANKNQISKYAKETPISRKLAKKFLPGPLTLVLVNRGKLAGIPGRTIGIRVPDEPVSHAILKLCGPLTATSANIHGFPEPIEISIAKDQLKGKVDVYIDAGKCRVARGSTVVDATSSVPKVLREGAISARRVEDAINAA